jgi:DNA topoisomerase-3
VLSVAVRIELDLRIGYAFTRHLTNSLRPLGGPLSVRPDGGRRVISFGKVARTLIGHEAF